jgi:predicted permease
VTNPIWEELRKEQTLFDGLFAFDAAAFNLAESGEARRVDGTYVGGDYFKTLGVVPAAGRLLTGADDYRGCPAIAVLGYGFWNSEYGSDAAAIGRTLMIDAHPFQIVGVAAQGFFGTEVGRSPRLYLPLCAEAVIQGKNSILDERAYWSFKMMGRPKEGVTLAEINTRLEAMSAASFARIPPAGWDGENLERYLKTKYVAHEATTGYSNIRVTYTPALYLLMSIVGVVLLIACGNVANLLLARATVRQREVAMRLALGASRGRLVRQLLTESLLLALLGAVTGFFFARWGSALLMRMLSGSSGGIWVDLAPDARLLGFTIAVAVVTALLFGLIPAWRATRVDPQVAMRANGRGVLSGSTKFTLGKALVLTQVALSLVLVTGAGLMLGTFRNLAELDPGFRRDGLLAVRMDLRATGYDDARRLEIQRQGLDRLRTVPGVLSAATAEIMPVSGMGWNGVLEIPGKPAPANRRDAMSFFNRVSTQYFETMGTRVVAGREFGVTDQGGSVQVAIINETVAKRFFDGVNPIGQPFRTDMGPGGPKTFEVIGVVQDAKYRSLREDPTPTVYVAERQTDEPAFSLTYMVHVDGVPADMVPSIRAALLEVDGRISFSAFPFSRQLNGSLTRERMLATLSGFFGVLAMLLALVGIYGIMAYSVARRRNEIGIRLALGADRGEVLRMVLFEVTRLLALGVAAGVIIALAAGRLVTSFLYGLSAGDPQTLLIAVGGVLLVGLAAGAVPAWRAARLDPVTALREE